MKATAPRQPTVGFGCPAHADWPHHWAVHIPADRNAPVRLTEDHGVGTDGPEDRETIDRATWSAVADPLRGELNARLKSVNLTSGRWKIGENRVERMLGCEVALLLLAACEQPKEAVPAIVANWMGLEPSQRWWLHRKASGSPAWREAMRVALTENPLG